MKHYILMLLFTVFENKETFGRPSYCAIGICLYSFCRAFDGASFEKNLRFYHLFMLRYMQNKMCTNILGHPVYGYHCSCVF